MKTFKNLYPQIYTFENLYQAFLAARKGKRNRSAVASFEFNLELNLLNLEEALQTESYYPGAYTNFYIYEPKKRLVSAAPFTDRVVHHALYQVISPIWEKRFLAQSYACRVGKGTHQALNKAHQWLKNYQYSFHGDIVKYFPAIDHAILQGLLHKHLACVKTQDLIAKILHSGKDIFKDESPRVYFPGDDLFALNRPRGLPIGNLTSQFWANVYLHELDMYVKHQLGCKAYLRYMDDFVLFSNSKQELQQWKEAIKEFLGQHLRLLLHPRKSVVAPAKVGLDFCGFRLYPTHRRLRRSSIRRFIKRFRRQRQAYWQGEYTLEQLHQSTRCWIAHASHGDTWRLRGKLFEDYPISPKRQANNA